LVLPPQIAIWLWGHQHKLVIYKKQIGILARCSDATHRRPARLKCRHNRSRV